MCYTHSASRTEVDETAGSMQTAKIVMDNVLDGISSSQWSIPASSLWDEGNTEVLIFTVSTLSSGVCNCFSGEP